MLMLSFFIFNKVEILHVSRAAFHVYGEGMGHIYSTQITTPASLVFVIPSLTRNLNLNAAHAATFFVLRSIDSRAQTAGNSVHFCSLPNEKRPEKLESFFAFRYSLVCLDRAGGALALASAAIDASVRIHNVFAFAFGYSRNGASSRASAARYTFVVYFVCHDQPP